ncbi:unnamed protein product [Didymodactylos carnosus]|uniref:NAD(P)(+)--arginine ADP-ribosyltransferase n=1 Tax=Didymodactylos carnosus TaxID=1234261 RepID=A0A815PTM4_9BILA|nr:unnamed protein product [Didymodactylos carnosus]CAF1453786.1 unnamed protein product [Didymodactylos carnosus]CAF3962036.1 unnamed protein product [Didymodactylos carnosus]CAF4326333.1 unnamed protein product [Didymodactylos carnosus]
MSKKTSSISAPTVKKKPVVETTENPPNLESYVLLWLDGDINKTHDNIETLKELRQVINYIQTFDDIEQCESYIREIQNEKVLLIVSGSIGRRITSRIHDLTQFSGFYVYCQDKASNEKWAKSYSKVKGVFTRRDELVSQIAVDQATRSKVDDITSVSVFTRDDNENAENSLESRNASFMWFQLFVEVLLRMYHKSSARNELISLCKKSYVGNKSEQTLIDEFERQYKPDKAIWWYTHESCLYRILNKALRVQDFHTIFALRSFITDIAKQLKKENERFIRTSNKSCPIIKVYHGQGIDIDELNLMKSNIGEFISMNCFLSTSKNRATALRFARQFDMTKELGRILFEIDIDTRLLTKAFADITHLSYYKGEDEVLIMLGAMFRIEKISYDKKEQMWIPKEKKNIDYRAI